MGVFKKGKTRLETHAISTLITEGSVIEGSLTAPAYARIDGRIASDVTVTEGLILGEKGMINGDVITKELVIYGIINGDIIAETVEIRSSGKVTGNIRTNGFAVEAGGIYSGNIVMSPTTESQ